MLLRSASFRHPHVRQRDGQPNTKFGVNGTSPCSSNQSPDSPCVSGNSSRHIGWLSRSISKDSIKFVRRHFAKKSRRVAPITHTLHFDFCRRACTSARGPTLARQIAPNHAASPNRNSAVRHGHLHPLSTAACRQIGAAYPTVSSDAAHAAPNPSLGRRVAQRSAARRAAAGHRETQQARSSR
jgi:hypothetical protein